MNKLYVLVGVPASGKSTWVNNQEWAQDCAIVSTDFFIEEEAAKQGKTYNEVFDDFMPVAIRLMENQVMIAQANNMDIIWDQTSVAVKSRKKKLNMLPKYYPIAVVFKTPEKEELEKRLNSRIGKTIPKYVVESMIETFVMPTEEEGFREIWIAA
jgi:predicted kinase